MRKTWGKNVCGYLLLGESVEELHLLPELQPWKQTQKSPSFLMSELQTPESASVEHLATRSTDQDKGKAVQLTKTLDVAAGTQGLASSERVLGFDSDMLTRVGNKAASTITELEAFMERFKRKKYSARLAPRFWSLEGPQADFR